MMQMFIQMMQQNSAVVNKLEEINQKLEKNNQKLEETRAEIRTRMVHNMEIIQRQLKMIQEGIHEKGGKKYMEVHSRIVERKEQNRDIVNYIEEKIKIENGTENNINMNYRKIEKETPKLHPSKNEHPKVFVQELQNYLEILQFLITIGCFL